jgi:hypothetical protein
MQPSEYAINLVLSVILIVGGYQFYFFTQRHPLVRIRTFNSSLDEWIPFWPSWAWIYSFLYYPAILYLNWIASDSRQFNAMAFTFMVLLFAQMLCFWVFPVTTPAHWRNVNPGRSLSEKFLRFVQKFDAPTNCFPSMHVSVAVLTALFALPTLGPWVWAFPVLIALSCAFTKQHYLMDLPFGAALGFGAHRVYLLLA